ncbi:MAG: hypothetical protein JNK64_01670 [Myxococcales bacterium]|nr:hypothetical protein [Myxococcales bacterium]
MRAAIIVVLALGLAACVERRTYQVVDAGPIDTDRETFMLTVAGTGRGSGTITSEPAGIDCGVDCQEVFERGSVVTLTARAAPGSVVSGWSYPGCTRATCTLTIDATVELTVSFDTAPTYPLLVTREGSGAGSGTVRSTPVGIDCGATCTADFVQGSQVELMPSAPSGVVFTRWNGACTGSGACVVTMDAALEVKATFSVGVLYNLQVLIGGSGVGTVQVTPPGTTCSGTQPCNSPHPGGEPMTLTAIPQAGSQFVGWRGACASFGLAARCELTFAGSGGAALADFDTCTGC